MCLSAHRGSAVSLVEVWGATTWCGLAWSEWVPFDGGSAARWPKGPGVYRVRIADDGRLAYIGQTGRDLRGRLRDLRANTLADVMPFNDPHTAAPGLWAWRHAEGFAYEASAALTSLGREERMALECWLLWMYRRQHGRTTLCNLGHFHRHYLKSRNRSTALRGGALEARCDSPAEHRSHSPLALLPPQEDPAAPTWMGLDWSAWSPMATVSLAAVPAVYRLRGSGAEVCYFGQTGSLGERIRSHRLARGAEVEISHAACPPETITGINRLEIENDLIAGFFEVKGRAPVWQFGERR